jgi:hypothetical protein
MVRRWRLIGFFPILYNLPCEPTRSPLSYHFLSLITCCAVNGFMDEDASEKASCTRWFTSSGSSACVSGSLALVVTKGCVGLSVSARYVCTVRRRITSIHDARVANRDTKVLPRTSKMLPERWTNPKRSRCACSPRYALQPWRKKSADVTIRWRERSPTRNPLANVRFATFASMYGAVRVGDTGCEGWEADAPTAAPLKASPCPARAA